MASRNRCLQFLLIILSFISVWGAASAQGNVQAIQSVQEKVPLLNDWRYNASDNPSFKNSGWNDTEWPVFAFSLTKNKKIEGSINFLWLRKKVVFNSPVKGIQKYILSSKMSGSMDVFFNGIQIYRHGEFPPSTVRYTPAVPKTALIPEELIRYDEPNTIAIRLYFDTGDQGLSPVFIGTYDDYSYEWAFVDFLNIKINLIFSILSLVLGFYYQLHFWRKKSIRVYLYFSLVNFCFAIYFLNMGVDLPVFDVLTSAKISQGFMPMFFGLLVVFFVNYFDIHNNKWFKRLVMILAVIMSLMIGLVPQDMGVLGLLFTLALLPGALELFFMSYIAVRATIQKNRDALPIMVGALFGLVFGIYDMTYQMMGITPFAWLQGIGIFLFNMSMFVSLSTKSIRTLNSLEDYSREIILKTATLEEFIGNISDVTGRITGINKTLEDSLSVASGSMNEIASSSQSIFNNVKTQSEVVRKTNLTVMELLNSVDVTYRDLSTQYESVQNTRMRIEGMLSSIQQITDKLKDTSNFAGKLGQITQEGEEAVYASMLAMNQIKEVSEDMFMVVDAVKELAEQTGVLSINAAIEAAQAGDAGKGFSVVAEEVKNLAEGSGAKVKEIIEHINMIKDSIEEGVKVNTTVNEILKDIRQSTVSTITQVQSIYSSLADQRKTSEDVHVVLDSLHTLNNEIKEQADKQSASSHDIKNDLTGLVEDCRDVSDSVGKITNEIQGMQDIIQKIQTIYTESSAIVGKLKKMLETRD
ncbi:MAG: hypothetical protein JW969_04615 [Spirochaetales bacterium]|nr:hypothetical protein [Spirochaetales bacterium]